MMLEEAVPELSRQKERSRDYGQQVENYMAEANRYKQHKKDADALIERLTQESEAKKGEVTEKAKALYRMFMRHSAVESFKMDRGAIKITTKLIFADIRLKDGSRDLQRACLGAFVFTIGKRNFRIKNLLFDDSEYDHWGVSQGNPCLGEYRKDFDAARNRNDWYGLFDLMYHYMRSIEDSGAYKRAHYWRNERRLTKLAPDAAKPLEVGSYVICTEQDAEGKALIGLVGKVIWKAEDFMSIEFKENVGGHMGEGGTGKDEYCWNLHAHQVAAISQEMYEAKSKYDIADITIPVRSIFSAVDNLPDGSSLEDAKGIAAETYKKNKDLAKV